MAHDREFQRKRKDTRMPVRDSHGEDQPAARQTEQDFDLRRARDTPSSVNGKTHRQDIPVQTEFSHKYPFKLAISSTASTSLGKKGLVISGTIKPMVFVFALVPAENTGLT